MPIPDHALKWNELAEKHNLPNASVYRAKERAEQIDYYQSLVEDFWKDLDTALGRRGAWAKSHRFPTFEQVMDEAIVAKLMEGIYEDEESPQSEHVSLVSEILRCRMDDRLPGGSVICLEGLEAARGLERWAEIPLERLKKMIEDVTYASYGEHSALQGQQPRE